jgi:hypothetical protein
MHAYEDLGKTGVSVLIVDVYEVAWSHFNTGSDHKDVSVESSVSSI